MFRIGYLSRNFSGKAPKIENIRRGWNKYAVEYGDQIEVHTLPSQIAMFDYISPKKNNAIFMDACCGTGVFGAFLAKRKEPTQTLIMADLSDKMVEISKKRVTASLQSGRLFSEISDFENVVPDEDLLLRHNIKILEADLCSPLTHLIPKESVDVLLCGLGIHLVPSPKDLLSAFRPIMAKGGRVGLSVFGSKEKSAYFDAFDNALPAEIKAKFRSKFHLNEEEKLGGLCLEAGMTGLNYFRQFIPFEPEFANNVELLMASPANQAVIINLAEEEIQSIKDKIKARFDKENLNKQAIGVESLCVIGHY